MGGIGLALILIGAFIAVIAIKGTYKYLPPWNKGQSATTSFTLSQAVQNAGNSLGSQIATT